VNSRFALTLHNIHAAGRHNIRDNDLSRLQENWPDLEAVFEEVQFLRDMLDRTDMEGHPV
jgi:hypothetical protein